MHETSFTCSPSGSLEVSEIDSNSVASIAISNENLNKSGESVVVTGKGMGSTVKVGDLLI